MYELLKKRYRKLRRVWRNSIRWIRSQTYYLIPNQIIRIWKTNPNHKWLFIIGTNNSGTTLLRNILSEHSDISDMGAEGQFRTFHLPSDRDYGLDRVSSERPDIFRLTENDDANHLQVFYDWYLAYTNRNQYLLEKSTPNVLRMRWLNKHFAPANFIIIVRSPYAVIEGMKRKVGVPIERATAHWCRVHKIIMEDISMLDKHLLITYDELTEKPKEIFDLICNMLNIPNSFNIESKEFTIHGVNSEIKNMDYKSINNLSEEEIIYINKSCSDLMNKYRLPIHNI